MSKTHGTHSLAPSRRDVLIVATAIGGGLVAASLLGRRAFGADRKLLKVRSWEQFQPGEKDGWNALFDKFNQSQTQYAVEWTGWPAGQLSEFEVYAS